MASKLQELREKRAKVHADFTEELKKDQTVETRAAVAKMNEEMDGLTTDIKNIEAADKRSVELGNIAATNDAEVRAAAVHTTPVKQTQEQIDTEYRAAFLEYMRNGDSATPANIRFNGGVSDRSHAFLRAVQTGRMEKRAEFRTDDQQSSMWGRVSGQTYTGGNESTNGIQNSGIAGGFLVPAGFQYEIETATKYYAPLMDGSAFRTIETAGGGILPFPTSNDTVNVCATLADAVQDTEQSIPFGVVNFGAFKFTSRIVRISVELLQDSAFNLESYLAQMFGIRFGRGLEQFFTTGTGSTQPTGVITAVLASGAVPVVGAGSNANDGLGQAAYSTIGSNDLINLEHSVDPTYRRGAKFMLSDTSLKTIKLLLDKYGRPLWVPGLTANAPDTILGYQYVINQSMASPAISTNPATVLFGDLQKFIIRKVKDMSVLRLNERYADYGQVGFISFMRADRKSVV